MHLNKVIFLIIVLMALCACSTESTSSPTNQTATSTSAFIFPQGRTISIAYGEEAFALRDALGIRFTFPGEAYSEGWQPWLAQVALENPTGASFPCLTSNITAAGVDETLVNLTDTGGFARTARIYMRDNSYGLPWNICDGSSAAAYVLGVLPLNQQPASGDFMTKYELVPIDFHPGFTPQFPQAQNETRQPSQSQTIHVEGAEIYLEPLAATENSPINVRVTVTNNGGYNFGLLDFMAIDNLGRYYNSDFAERMERVPPGFSKTYDTIIGGAFPESAPGQVTSAMVMVFYESSDGYRYAGSYFADLSSAVMLPAMELTATAEVDFWTTPDAQEVIDTFYGAQQALLDSIESNDAASALNFFLPTALIDFSSFDEWMTCSPLSSLVLYLPRTLDDIVIDYEQSRVFDPDNVKLALTIRRSNVVDVQCHNGGRIVREDATETEPQEKFVYLTRRDGAWRIGSMCYAIGGCDWYEMPVWDFGGE